MLEFYDPDKKRMRLAFSLDPQPEPTPESRIRLAQALLDPLPDPSIGKVDRFGNRIGSFDRTPAAGSSLSSDELAETPGAPGSLPPGDSSKALPLLSGLWGPAQRWVYDGGKLYDRGGQHLIDNPILTKRWESTTSAWNGTDKFSRGLQDLLRMNGIEYDPKIIHPIPPGSAHPGSMSQGKANNLNGRLAEEAIADLYRRQGFDVEMRKSRQGGARFPDVIVQQPADDPRHNRRLEIESKVGYTTPDDFIRNQINNDRLAHDANRAERRHGGRLENSGRVLRTVGKIARPVGVVLDAYELGSAYQADGNRIGENTKQAASGIAGGALGGWGGAAAGFALGAPFGPPGWLIGGIGGGLAGALGGDIAARKLYNTIRSWY